MNSVVWPKLTAHSSDAPAAQMMHVSFEVAAAVLDDVPLSHRVQFKACSPAGGDDHEPAGQGCGEVRR